MVSIFVCRKYMNKFASAIKTNVIFEFHNLNCLCISFSRPLCFHKERVLVCDKHKHGQPYSICSCSCCWWIPKTADKQTSDDDFRQFFIVHHHFAVNRDFFEITSHQYYGHSLFRLGTALPYLY